jgi:hypothetical protein
MGHSGTADVLNLTRGKKPLSVRPRAVNHSVLVVRDEGVDYDLLDGVCGFLDIGVEYIASKEELGPMLRVLSPMAVIADLAGKTQDGYHVMKVAAHYDRDLPVLLLTDKDPALLGAMDAVQEVWSLRRVATMRAAGEIGALVDFLCHAARDAGMSRLMRV